MGNTSIARISRTGVMASVIFVVGAGIGWHLADFVFAPETPAPMVAAIRFEGEWPREAVGRRTTSGQDHGAVQVFVPPKVESYRPLPDAASGPSEEERNLAAALRWAERYRQRQDMAAGDAVVERARDERQRLAAAEFLGWDEVAENARRFGPVRGVQDVIRAQIEREREGKDADRSKLAGIAAGKTSPADRAAVPVAQRVEAAEGKPVLKQGKAMRRQAIHRPHPRASRKVRGEKVVCPLLWLERAVFERAGGGSRSRRAAAG